ncbi:MAG TPA: ROK family transcriptional regulator [Mycobacteriales bacterium]|nr:ROK family transcriptional regulator [Mycobacteriales bacterium]
MRASPAARPDAIRRHNLALILGHVHRDGALTRAELTQRLGVSRSTIGVLVSDLIEHRLVEESVPSGGAGVGRPSYVVGPHPHGPYVIAVDVTVTHFATAAVGIGGSILARRTVPCGPEPPSPAEAADLIAAAVADLPDATDRGCQARSVGVSVPGTIDRLTKRVGVAPNLGWRDAPLGELLHERLGGRLPVEIGNDADLSVLAELRRGVARGCEDVVYLIGRTGVGAGVVVNGAPVRGRDGRAGEVGHNVVDRQGPPCHCGKNGCLETFIGDAALLGLAGRRVEPTAQNVAEVFADARGGDRRAADAIRTLAASLGQAVGNLVNTLNPQRVILGGTFSGVLDLARSEVEEAVRVYAFDAGHPVELCTPQFGTDSALLGAAELALTDLLADPLG